MKDFKKFDGGFNRRDGGRPSFGGKPGFKKFDRSNDRPPMMHKATCTDCGKGCEVPFRPSGDKPVLCNNCFGDKRGGNQPQGGERRFDSRRDVVVSHNTFSAEKSESRPDRRIDDLKMQIDALHKKLDSVLEIIKTTPVSVVKKEMVKEDTFTEVKKTASLGSMVKKAVQKTPAQKTVLKVAPKKAEKKVVAKKKVATKKK